MRSSSTGAPLRPTSKPSGRACQSSVYRPRPARAWERGLLLSKPPAAVYATTRRILGFNLDWTDRRWRPVDPFVIYGCALLGHPGLPASVLVDLYQLHVLSA